VPFSGHQNTGFSIENQHRKRQHKALSSRAGEEEDFGVAFHIHSYATGAER
jgi:hypothetical protein